MYSLYRFPLIFILSVGTQALAADTLPENLLADAKPQFCLAAKSPPAWKDELPKEGGPVRARWVFSVPESNSWVYATLQSSQSVESCLVNSTRARSPVKGMRCATLPGISPKWFRAGGSNSLEIEFSIPKASKKKPAPPTVALIPLTPADLAFQTGPVLGDAGPDYFTVGCRTNMPAEVLLEAAGRRWKSPTGLVHSFRATELQAGTVQDYTLTARITGTVRWDSHAAQVSGGEVKKKIGPFHVSTLPLRGQPLRFAAMGDSRTYPKDWARVARAVVEKNPAFVVFSGDMVADGREDRRWDAEFFGAAKTYFASIPTFYVLGNHEGGSPLLGTLVPVAGRDHWKAMVGGALLIGIDGAQDWSAKSANVKWIETILQESREPFIFVFSHYPPWSSGFHGAVRERTSIEPRENILPLMKKYGATAFIAGHDHDYERSEPPDGVTVIVSGGAGAPLYPKVPLSLMNPYSKVFRSVHHFCLFEINGKQCTLQALTPDGKLLDSKTWTARVVK
jgi:hypothetical protein